MAGAQLQQSPRKCKLNHSVTLDIYQNASNEKMEKDKWRPQNSSTLLWTRELAQLLWKSRWHVSI